MVVIDGAAAVVVVTAGAATVVRGGGGRGDRHRGGRRHRGRGGGLQHRRGAQGEDPYRRRVRPRVRDVAWQQRQVLQRLAALALHDVAELLADGGADAVVGLQALHLVVEVAVHRVDLAQLVVELGELVVLGEPGARREPEQGSGDRGRDDQGPEPEQPRRATLRGDPVAPVDAVATGTSVGDPSPPGIRGAPGPRSGDGGGRAAAPIERLRVVDRVDRPARRARRRPESLGPTGAAPSRSPPVPSSMADSLAAATGPGAARRR